MPKDYKKNSIADTSPANYIWMFAGIVLGLLIGVGMYLYANKDAIVARIKPHSDVVAPVISGSVAVDTNNPVALEQEEDPISVIIESARQEQQHRKRATFSYYAVLPDIELDVNEVKTSTPEVIKKTVKRKKETKKVILKPGSYVLRIASFSSKEQARRSQGGLKKLGLTTRIQKKSVRGKDWFRVFAGPTLELSDINRWKVLAGKAGFKKPLIVKLP